MKRQDYAITISKFDMEVPGGIVKGTRLDISKPTGENKIQFIHIYNNDDLVYTTTAINGAEVIDRNEVDDVIEIKIYK